MQSLAVPAIPHPRLSLSTSTDKFLFISHFSSQMTKNIIIHVKKNIKINPNIIIIKIHPSTHRTSTTFPHQYEV